MATQESECGSSFFARYKEVQSAGKKRPLLIFDENVELLAPMHSMMYHHLCKQDWVLCGPPTEERMKSVLVGDYQTSVDLVAATDGLRHDVALTLLDALFFTSVKIPRSLRSLAKGSLSPIFRAADGTLKRVRQGQMMGSYLSFPLLCLQSYCAASWAARFDSEARFIVNGDDCVISASRYVTVQDYPSGYRLNDDKTIRAQNVAEINSTCFLRQGGKWREVRHLRRGGATTDFSGMMHMAKAVCTDQKLVDAFQRCRIGRRWGFLPSQLGHFGYPAHLRESGLMERRTWTPLPLPELDLGSEHEELLVVTGRDPSPCEAEALRVVMWTHGRLGGLKRDAYNPSCGYVRRSYSYRKLPRKSPLSYVRKRSRFTGEKERGWFLVPASFQSEEERRGLDELVRFRADWDSGFITLCPLDVEA
nr:MAG: RNA-dependent RNA polymerase [Botourmiaviridae sp.]